MIFGLFGGLIADHWPKRRTLIATQTSAMVLAFALFALTATHTVQVWHILVLAVLLNPTWVEPVAPPGGKPPPRLAT